MNFSGKKVLIIGGSRGIGAAIVARFAQENARIVFTFKAATERAHALVRSIIASGGHIQAIQCDNADTQQISETINSAIEILEGIDIVVVSAGIYNGGPLEHISLEDIDATYAVNIRALLLFAQGAAKHMRSGGRIIFIGSNMAERVPRAGATLYALSKTAIVGMTKGLARDLGHRGITVNNIQPGPVDTEMNPATTEKAQWSKNNLIALQRYGRAEEIASMVAYVAGPDAAFVTGASLTVDGGYSI